MLVTPHARDYTSPLSARSSVAKRRSLLAIFRDRRPQHVDPVEWDDLYESIFAALAASRVHGWIDKYTACDAA
jgi:hypothetical protein